MGCGAGLMGCGVGVGCDTGCWGRLGRLGVVGVGFDTEGASGCVVVVVFAVAVFVVAPPVPVPVAVSILPPSGITMSLGSPPGGPAVGVRPSFKALTISVDLNLAYKGTCLMDSSNGPNCNNMSKKVAAA